MVVPFSTTRGLISPPSQLGEMVVHPSCGWQKRLSLPPPLGDWFPLSPNQMVVPSVMRCGWEKWLSLPLPRRNSSPSLHHSMVGEVMPFLFVGREEQPFRLVRDVVTTISIGDWFPLPTNQERWLSLLRYVAGRNAFLPPPPGEIDVPPFLTRRNA
jgi:hypothetical protein